MPHSFRPVPFGQNLIKGHAAWMGPCQGIGRQKLTLARLSQIWKSLPHPVTESVHVFRAGPLGDWSLPRKSSVQTEGAYHKLSLTRASPRWSDFSESANVWEAEPPQGQTSADSGRRRVRPLGDWSLPRRSSGGLRRAKNQLSVTV